MAMILVIDDDKDMCMLLRRFLSRNGFEVTGVPSGKAGLQWLEENEPDLILCDFRLDDMTGAEILRRAKEKFPEVPFIIITGYSDVKDAVDVMKMGAYDYVTKPLFPDEILVTIRKAIESASTNGMDHIGSRKVVPTRDLDAKGKNMGRRNFNSDTDYILGESAEFKQVLQQIDLVSPTNFSVIIYGESGSGKEAIAQQIHRQSLRSDQPFVAIDCGALSRELAGSELFGHEKGSFTGALSQKIGSFELANGGTIFLDEISNLSYDIQVSLLRVVQERRMRRVGGNKDIPLDVRIIIASNERLWDSARKGKFREDLFHRFNEFSIEVPPLRDRRGDIMLFARHFLDMTNEELGKNVKGFRPEVEEILLHYVWYGNLRELKNVIKRSTLLTEGNYIEVTSLPFEIAHFRRLQFDSSNGIGSDDAFSQKEVSLENKLKSANLDAEYEVILDALKQANFNKSKAAKLLNIDRKTLYNKMRQFKAFKLDE